MRTGAWTELLQTLIECTKAPSEHLRQSAYSIIAAAPDMVSSQSPEAVTHVLSEALRDTSLNVTFTFPAKLVN